MSLKHVEFGFFFVVTFFSVVHNLKHDTQQLNLETNFSEIKKNISFVNHLLKDLLQKYAQLKQLAKTAKKNTEPKLDTRADEFFQGDSNIRVKAKVKLAKPHKFVGTTLFLSDTSTSFERSDSDRNKNNEQRAKESNDEDDSLSPDSIDSREVTSITRQFKGLSQNQKGLLADKEKKKSGTVKVDFSYDKVMQSNPKEIKDLKDVEKVLVIHLGGTEKTNIKKHRASSPKPVFIQSIEKQQTTKSILFKSEATGHHDSDVEEEKAMQEEILKIKYLRQAYGKACSQVVARKCQNALKAVLKDVCKSGRKCADDFNDDFSSNGIAACNKEFKQNIKNRGRQDYPYSDDDDYVNIHQQISEQTGAKFIDYTREGDLDMTCLQALSNIKELNVARDEPDNKDAKPQEVHQLRDRYEKACIQASYEKCMQACKSTSDKTCTKYDCITEKTKALKQSCKRRCKESNGYQGDSNSNSSASSGSSSVSSN